MSSEVASSEKKAAVAATAQSLRFLFFFFLPRIVESLHARRDSRFFFFSFYNPPAYISQPHWALACIQRVIRESIPSGAAHSFDEKSDAASMTYLFDGSALSRCGWFHFRMGPNYENIQNPIQCHKNQTHRAIFLGRLDDLNDAAVSRSWFCPLFSRNDRLTPFLYSNLE